MKKLKLLALSLLLLCPFFVLAQSEDYVDKTASFANVNPPEGKVALYYFWGDGCPHCEDLKNWLENMQTVFGDNLIVYDYEVWNNVSNKDLMNKVKEANGVEPGDGVPFTVVGEYNVYGFGLEDPIKLENIIRHYLNMEEVTSPTYSPFENGNESEPVQKEESAQTQEAAKPSSFSAEGLDSLLKVLATLTQIWVQILMCILLIKLIRKIEQQDAGEKKNDKTEIK